MTTPTKEAPSSVLVLAGGGIDSTLCMYQLHASGTPFRALHIAYGQNASGMEWRSVQSIAAQLGRPALQLQISSHHSFHPGEVQGRNAAFVFLALMHTVPTEKLICIGIHDGTPFFDCSTYFFDATSKLVAEHTDSRVRLIAPLLDLTKPEIVELARKAAIPLDLTYSCQSGVNGGCGACHSCKDREALGC
jgi:7-cyano-7-deazaguanine synthase